MRKKALIITPDLRGGGAQKVIVRLLKSFDRTRIDPVLLVFDYTGPFCKDVPDDVTIVDLGVSRVRYALPKMLRKINEIKPDVIMSTLERVNFTLLMARPLIKRKTKIVIREANMPTRTVGRVNKAFRLLYYGLYRFLYPKADLVIAQSDRMRDEIMQYVGVRPDKVITIHNPIDVEAIAQLADECQPFEEGRDRNIVAVGRLEYQKGHDILIDAFKMLNEQMPHTKLYILGQGSEYERLREQAKTLGILDRVQFIGFVDNPYPYIKNADLFVLPSRYEGFPNVLLEALACNAKIVAADCESGPREILSRTEYGLLVEANQALGLANGMIKGLTDHTVGREGYARAGHYESRKIARLYETVLLTL